MEGLDETVLVELGITLGDLLKEILVKLSYGSNTRVPMSKSIGGAEMTASFSECLSDFMDLVSVKS